MSEQQVLRFLAIAEADFLWQIPSHVHLLTACLIRGGAVDSSIDEQGVCTEMAVRGWAASNFESEWHEGDGRYTGQLDFEYTICTDGDKISIVGRHSCEPEVSYDGDGEHVFIVSSPEWEERFGEAIQEIYRFVADSTRNLGDDAPPGPFISTILDELLGAPEVRECLRSIGGSL